MLEEQLRLMRIEKYGVGAKSSPERKWCCSNLLLSSVK